MRVFWYEPCSRLKGRVVRHPSSREEEIKHLSGPRMIIRPVRLGFSVRRLFGERPVAEGRTLTLVTPLAATIMRFPSARPMPECEPATRWTT